MFIASCYYCLHTVSSPLYTSLTNTFWNLLSQVHEMVMLIEEPGSVICWDFDVMKNDVSFSVLRTKVPITHRPEPQSPTGEACDIPWSPCQVSYNKGRLMFSLKAS